jgi:hypothetical protein
VSTTLQIISVIVSPSVVAGYALYRQQLERTTAAENELRAVLDGAAEKLEAVVVLNEQLEVLWRREADPNGEPARDLRDKRTQAVFSARVARDKIAIRIPAETQTYARYESGLKAADDYARGLRGFLTGDAYDSETVGRLKRALADAQLEFMEAARNQVGVQRHYRWPSPLWPTLPLPRGRTN